MTASARYIKTLELPVEPDSWRWREKILNQFMILSLFFVGGGYKSEKGDRQKLQEDYRAIE